MAQSEDWIRFLLEQSNLPGPRANLELLWVVVAPGEMSHSLTGAWNTMNNPPNKYSRRICGGMWRSRDRQTDLQWKFRVLQAIEKTCLGYPVEGQGRRSHGTSTNWTGGLHGLIAELELWKQGNPYEKRAVVAGLCEPDLLINKEHAEAVLTMVFEVANALTQIQQKRDEPFKALRKGLGYGLSVAIVASPVKGKVLFEKLAHSPDRDIQWVVKENLKKNRLMRMDPGWVRYMQSAKHSILE